jgi:hypothetical protein
MAALTGLDRRPFVGGGHEVSFSRTPCPPRHGVEVARVRAQGGQPGRGRWRPANGQARARRRREVLVRCPRASRSATTSAAKSSTWSPVARVSESPWPRAETATARIDREAVENRSVRPQPTRRARPQDECRPRPGALCEGYDSVSPLSRVTSTPRPRLRRWQRVASGVPSGSSKCLPAWGPQPSALREGRASEGDAGSDLTRGP